MTIELDRHFRILKENEDTSDYDILKYSGFFDSTVSWQFLLEKKRVVILAEAGSGKSTELKTKSEQLSKLDETAFFIPLHSVAREGLVNALSPVERTLFDNWKNSENSAYFFIDSVDEAKDAQVRFDDALKKIAEGIAGCEGRCSIIISGRYTDWEFHQDNLDFKKRLPLPPHPQVLPVIDQDEALLKILNQENPDDEEDNDKKIAEDFLVMLMTKLSPQQMEKYFKAKGITNVPDLIAGIERGNLRSFITRPLDLNWIGEFWEREKRIGNLGEMIHLSILEKMKEPNVSRKRGDHLDTKKAMICLKRTAAALIFGRAIEIQSETTPQLFTKSARSISIAEITPDLSSAEQIKLLSRPVFDPATRGRTRLINDNEGVVRSFLCAKWLADNTQARWRAKPYSSLLFATIYGEKVVRPASQEVAAWLALDDTEIAKEIIAIDPELLMVKGDPRSLKLSTREAILESLVYKLSDVPDTMGIDKENLGRFATPDLEACVRKLWKKYKHSTSASELLLRIIWVGQFASSLDLVEESLLNYKHRYGMLFAGRAISAMGSKKQKTDYVEIVIKHLPEISNTIIWEAVGAFFPDFLSVDQLIEILSKQNIEDRDGGLGLQRHGENILKKLENSQDVEKIFQKLQALLDLQSKDSGHESEFTASIILSIRRMLELTEETSIPDAAIDGALRMKKEKQSGRRYTKTDYYSLFQKTPERRRALLWTSVHKLRNMKQFGEDRFQDPWSVDAYGIPIGLRIEDIEWLKEDLVAKTSLYDQRLAANSIMRIWRESGEDLDLLNALKDLSKTNHVLAASLENYTKERIKSADEIAHDKQMAKHDREIKKKERLRDQSWRKFTKEISEDPSVLDNLFQPNEKSVDNRLYHLWKLITTANRSKWSVKNINMLRPILGDNATEKVQEAFIKYWKLLKPQAACERPENERNSVYAVDYLGLLGISLEANIDSKWAHKLTNEEAENAAIFATIELNGFPDWLSSLALSHPVIVSSTLSRLIELEIKSKDPNFASHILNSVLSANSLVQDLLSNFLWKILEDNIDLPYRVTEAILSILIKSGIHRTELNELCLARFEKLEKENCALYMKTAFTLDPVSAANVLEKSFNTMSQKDAVSHGISLFPAIFGSRFEGRSFQLNTVPAELIARLITMTFSIIRPEEDNKRPTGKVYSPDARDDAESARSHLLNALIERPGEFSYRALLKFANTPGFTQFPERLKELAYEKAKKDSDLETWTPSDVILFEQSRSRRPRTTKDLADIATEDTLLLQDDLVNSDFAQGKTLKNLSNESDVQSWVAHMLSTSQDSYTVERESQVIAGNMPDLRIRTSEVKSGVPIEIKVVDSWTLLELEDALKIQLCGQYLKDRTAKHGILLLVYQNLRPKGWQSAQGTFLNFAEVVSHLEKMAIEISSGEENAFQPRILTLDVSIIEAV